MAFSDTWYFGAARAARFTADQACQLDFGSTAIRNNAFQPGCFDRATDPDWTTPDQDAEALEALRAWHTEQQTAYEQWPHTHDADHGVGQTRRQLEVLGYVE